MTRTTHAVRIRLRAAAVLAAVITVVMAPASHAIHLEGDADQGRPTVASSGHTYMPGVGLGVSTTVAHAHVGGHQER